MLIAWRERARALKLETLALYFAYRDPRMPWYARAWAGLVLAYAFSPIDLIPDFIPVLGYLDDLLLVPLGIALALRMAPGAVMESARQEARAAQDRGRPVNWLAGAVIFLVWVGIAAWGVTILARILGWGS